MLHLPSEEFWELTYPEFQALVDRWEDNEMRRDHRFGVVASSYINCKLKEGSTPIQPLAWFGYVDQEDDREMTPEETAQQLEALVLRTQTPPKR